MRLGLRPTVIQGTAAAAVAQTASILVNGSLESSTCTGTDTSGTQTPVESPATWSKARKLYGGVDKMWERHRHRYEVNPEQVPRLEASGLTFVGKDEKGERMQILELKGTYFGVLMHITWWTRVVFVATPVRRRMNRSSVLPRLAIPS